MAATLIPLTQRTPHSFFAPDPAGLAAWLRGQGFYDLPGRMSYELARLKLGDELVICYTSGAIVCQGAAADAAVRRLDALCTPAVVAASLFARA